MTVHEHPSPHIVARFDDRNDARKAMLELERHGIDARRIEVHDAAAAASAKPQGAEERTSMNEMVRDAGHRAVGGSVIGGVIGVLLIGGAILLLDPSPLGLTLTIAVLCGAIAGSTVGALISGAAGVPANPEAFHTHEAKGPVELEVILNGHGDEDTVMETIRRHSAEVRST